MRCGPCEAWFDEQLSNRIARTRQYSLARFTLPSRRGSMALLLTPVGTVAVAFLWEHARRRRERKRFLAERRGPSSR